LLPVNVAVPHVVDATGRGRSIDGLK